MPGMDLDFPPSAKLSVRQINRSDPIGGHLSPCISWTFKQGTMEAGNHMSDNFMVDDFNIRHSSQRGYSLESFNSQWSRGPLNQYGALLQNGCVSCRSQCNLIQPLGQASLNRNGKKNLRNRDRREGDDECSNPLLTPVLASQLGRLLFVTLLKIQPTRRFLRCTLLC